MPQQAQKLKKHKKKTKTEEIMNYFVALSSTQDTAEQIEFFFSKANLVALFNKLCN